MTGLFISFEGVDGVGKTTQARRLEAYLRSHGIGVTVTREPGGTALGRAIRAMLLHGVEASASPDMLSPDVRFSDAPFPDVSSMDANGTGGQDTAVRDDAAGERDADIAPRTEALLFAADRAQHVAQIIRPALRRGEAVITDRYLDSSLAYQAGGRELTAREIRDLSMWATDGLLPDRTYVLDMDPEQSHMRLTHAADRMESAGMDFQHRTRRAFLDLAAAEPSRFRVIDASGTIDKVWAAIRADIDALLATQSIGETRQ